MFMQFLTYISISLFFIILFMTINDYFNDKNIYTPDIAK